MKHLYSFLAFVAVQVLGWGFAWLAGYDFDSRNFWVAYGAAIMLLLGGFAAAFVHISFGEQDGQK